MKRLISLFLCVGMVCTLMAGCGGKTETPSSGDAQTNQPADTQAQVVIKISHQNAVTHPTQKGLEKFKELLEEKSNGTMTCDIYDSAVLGNDTSNLQQVIAGFWMLL